MRVRDLQEFLSTFTASNKAGTRQGNAVSDAVLFVEVNGQLHKIKKMEVQENTRKNQKKPGVPPQTLDNL